MSRGSRFINISSLLLMNSLLVYLLTDTREHLSFLYCPRGPHWKTDVLGYKGVFPCNTSPLLSPFPFIILPYCLFPFHYSALLSVSLSLFCLIVCFQFIPPAYCLPPRDHTALCYCLSTIPRLCLTVFCANHRSMLLISSTVSFLCALHHLSNFITISAIYRQPRQAC